MSQTKYGALMKCNNPACEILTDKTFCSRDCARACMNNGRKQHYQKKKTGRRGGAVINGVAL